MAEKATIIYLKTIHTPLGDMLAGATDNGICMLEFADVTARTEKHLKTLKKLLDATLSYTSHKQLTTLEKQLKEYFKGTRATFEIALVLSATHFQKQVWQALQQIPKGATLSYKQMAGVIDNPTAVRAVGHANGANRISIIIPCHRLIGDSGKLTGYGGGVWRKQKLLELEQGTFVK